MEASSRVMASSLLLSDAFLRRGDSPSDDNKWKPARTLTSTEKMFLRQESETIDKGSWSPVRSIKFISFRDALLGYPHIYAQHYGVDFAVDTSRSEWECIIRMKRLRDLGAHGNIRSHQEPCTVTFADLKHLLIARKWYCTQLVVLPWIAGVEARGEVTMIDKLLKQLL